MADAGGCAGQSEGQTAQPGPRARRHIGKGPRAGGGEGLAVSVTVIDARRELLPRERTPVGAGLAEFVTKAAARDAHGILELALGGDLSGRTAVVSSFGAESAVLLHMVAAIDPTTPILFLNTGKLFGETLRYRDRLQQELGLCDVRSLAPGRDTRQALDADG